MGRIYSGYYAGIVLSYPADNPAIITGTVDGAQNGVVAPDQMHGGGNNWTISNYGHVEGAGGYGIVLSSDHPGNASGLITNGVHGTIAGLGGIAMSGGYDTVSNFGTVSGNYNNGVFLYNIGRVLVLNGSSTDTTARITGGPLHDGVFIDAGSYVTIGNQGIISGGYNGVQVQNGLLPINIYNGGRGSNSAVIKGTDNGIYIGPAEFGIWGNLYSPGPSLIGNAGTIAGGNGVVISQYDTSPVTVANAGMIAADAEGGVAVQFGSGPSTLIVDGPGAQFFGRIVGGDGANTLDFVNGGEPTQLPDGFSGFGEILLSFEGNNEITLNDSEFGSALQITVDGGLGYNFLDASETTGPVNLVSFSFTDTLIAGSDTRMSLFNPSLSHDDLIFTTTGTNVVDGFAPGDMLTFNDLDFHLGLPNPSSTPQPLPADLFSTQPNGTFDNTTERFAYDQATGQLFYSAHGAGGTARLVATLLGKPAISAANLFYTDSS